MDTERKLILYIAMSLDGYIATKDNDLSFLKVVEKEGEDYGYKEFADSIDTILIGRKTYDHLLSLGFEYPHTDKEVYIITRTERPPTLAFKYYSGNLNELVSDLKSKDGKNIYCDGGAEIVNELLKYSLIDEFIISVIPVLLGDGIKLFKSGINESTLHLNSLKQFEKGLLQLHYKIKRNT